MEMNMNFQKSIFTLAVGLALSPTIYASPIVFDAFNSNTLSANGTNQSSPEVELGFEINFFGERWDRTFVNENGNITFFNSFGSYTASSLAVADQTMIAPFFADVDAWRSVNDGIGSAVTYGQGFFEGYSAFGVNWIDVNSYVGSGESNNSFQLILVDRQDDGEEGDFDIIFNYEDIFWEAGDLSTTAPLAGFSNPPPWGTVSNTRSTDTTFFELSGSGQPGAFLNDGPHALAFNSYNSDVEGRYIFEFRGDTDIFSVPEPATLFLLGSGLLGLAFARRRVLNG